MIANILNITPSKPKAEFSNEKFSNSDDFSKILNSASDKDYINNDQSTNSKENHKEIINKQSNNQALNEDSKQDSNIDLNQLEADAKNIKSQSIDLANENILNLLLASNSNVDISDQGNNLESLIKVNNQNTDEVNDLPFFYSKASFPFIAEFDFSDTKETQNLINKFVSEFNLDRSQIETYINKIANGDFSTYKNNELNLGEFFKGVGVKDEHLDKAYKIINEVLARLDLKQNLQNNSNQYNTEDLVLLKNQIATKDFAQGNKNDNNIFNEKLNTINKLNNNLNNPDLSSDSQSNSSDSGFDQNLNLGFSQNLNKINNSSFNIAQGIDENLDMKVLKDTIVSNVKILSDKDGGSMQIDLKTNDLGKINLKVQTDPNNKVTISLVCDNNQTKKLIDSNMFELKSTLSSLNIKADSINVVLTDNTNMNFEDNKKEFLAQNSERKEQNFNDSSNKKDGQRKEKDKG